MRRKNRYYFLVFVLLISVKSQATGDASSLNNSRMQAIISDVSKIYLSSVSYIFKHQYLINQIGGSKEALFGQQFINNIKGEFQAKYSQDFPIIDHVSKKMLIQSMVEVMEDNRELINDNDIDFKGIIPAIFAFQLSAKLATKGVGVKIKFTRTKDNIRNTLNTPDAWESSVMELVKKSPRIYYDKQGTLNGKAAYRQFTPLPMQPYCLHCHGTMADNPLNSGKPVSQWSDIDVTGFKMEGWTLSDFGGGVSISIDKSNLQ